MSFQEHLFAASHVVANCVVAPQQQLCQEARYRQEATTYFSRCDVDEHIDLVAGTSTGPLGAVIHQRVISVPLKGQCWVLGQTFAGFSSRQIPMNAGKYVNMVHFPFPTKLWAFAPWIKAATMKCGYTWISLTITTMNRVRNTNNGFSSKKGLLLVNTAMCKADEEESDRSLSS